MRINKACSGWSKHEYQWSCHCGAWVCVQCGYHKNLDRCFCGWGLEPGEKLPDDLGEARFNGKNWHVY